MSLARAHSEILANQASVSTIHDPAEYNVITVTPEGRMRQEKMSMTTVQRAQQAPKEGDAAEMLAHLTPAQQLVLEFRNVSCWVDTGDFGAAKGPLQSIIKPMKDGAGKVTAAARRVTSTCTRSPAVSDSKDVEMGAAGPQSQGPPPSTRNRQILHSISGHVLPGQVLALMGPSGSGKTSLLSILGGRAPAKLKLDGAVTVNGARLSKATRRRIGFVLQDDVLYETLTVFETLTFAGLLRLPRTMTRAEKMARVETVMTVLGLTKARDTIIGGYFRRGVSGGERKRVSCGQELLINPSVLLLDEPTSGLDSTTALHLVKLLHDLAAGGRAILTTIHQPSSRLYHHLDKVMLLAEGHVMYMGDALLAADWFNHLGFQLPYGVNLADHLLDCAMGEVEYDSEAMGAYTGEGCRRGGPYNPEGSRRGGKDMHGRVAIASLYTTFERWYATHPNGFSHPAAPAANGMGPHDAAAMSKHEFTSRQSHDLTSRRSHLSQASSSNTMDSVLNEVKLVRCGRPSMQGAPVTPPTVEATAANDPELAAVGTDVPPPTPAVATHVAGASSAGPQGRGEPLTLKLGFRGKTRQLLGLTRQKPVNAVGPAAQQRPGPVAEGEKVQWSWTVTEGEGFQGAGLPGPGPVAEGKEPKGDDSVKDTPFFEQIGILWRRAIKVRRFESLSGQQMAQLVAVAAITGLLWWQRAQTDDVAGASDVLGLLFFELVFVAFRSLFSALFTFPNEFRILSKERPSGNPKLSAYYVARTLADLPIEVLLPSLFIIIVYFFGGLRLAAGAFFSNWASVLLIVLVAQSWGLLIGGMFMDPKTAQTVTTVIMLTLMLVGGFYVRDVPVWIGWLKYLSFLYWGNNLLLKIEFRGRTLTNCAAAVAGGPCPEVSDIQSALRLPVDPNEAVYPEVLVLIGMLIVLRYATWFVLRWKISATQRSL